MFKAHFNTLISVIQTSKHFCILGAAAVPEVSTNHAYRGGNAGNPIAQVMQYTQEKAAGIVTLDCTIVYGYTGLH
jgi:hypothetical protein